MNGGEDEEEEIVEGENSLKHGQEEEHKEDNTT